MYSSCILTVLMSTVCLVAGDINCHNPRGSNNRQDENTPNRQNAQRLFDSQNNARGGQNVGPFPGKMYYYAGSQLPIQWANQHTCGDQNNYCNVVIQYMCDENLRDGTTTNKVPVTCDEDCDTNPKFGQHESLTYYEQCAARERNKGLFAGNRENKMGESAQHTRQNNAGTRHGHECPEEKDYYPYWAPTPWKDIVIFESNQARCQMYLETSQNVMSRWACGMPDDYWEAVKGRLLNEEEKVEVFLFHNRTACENVLKIVNGIEYRGEWKEFPSHGIEPPECLNEPWARDNHQGNTIGGQFFEYNWTIPNIDADYCTLRIRYNISTNDWDEWNTDHTKNSDNTKYNLGPEEIYIDYTFAGENMSRTDKRGEAFGRRYCLRDRPKVDVFDLRRRTKKFQLRVALSTSQFGRTFQDRTHSFAIRQRPSTLDGAVIHNVNVRGKRGNIVQVFPSVMYDFVPKKLKAKLGDYVHFQWTGSDNNPMFAGQGKSKTDRSNIVQLGLRPFSRGPDDSRLALGTNYPRNATENKLWGVTENRMRELALGGYCKPGESLNGADAYFDSGPIQMTEKGVYHYFSTRNNNFGNQVQKGTIIIE